MYKSPPFDTTTTDSTLDIVKHCGVSESVRPTRWMVSCADLKQFSDDVEVEVDNMNKLFATF